MRPYGISRLLATFTRATLGFLVERPSHTHLRTHHLYVCPKESDELRRHLAFRDYLRSNPAAAREYGRIKEEAARLHPHDIEAYAEHKAPFIEKAYEELGL